MLKLDRRVLLFALLLSAALAVSSGFTLAQEKTMTTFKVVHIIGLEAIKHGAKGEVTVSKDALTFVSGPTKSDLSIAGIQDVQTGADSQRLIRGSLGTLSMFAPYESGRFLSLFRQKIDTLTIEYRDANGGLHGAIFTLPQGQAAELKMQLVAAGAKASVLPADETKQTTGGTKAEEKKQ